MVGPRSDSDSERLRDLHHAAVEISAASDVTTVYRTTVETAAEILDFDVCRLVVYRSGEFEVVASSRSGAGMVRPERDSSLARAFEEGKSIIKRETADEHSWEPPEMDVGSSIDVPVGERAVLQAVSNTRGHYGQTDVELAELLALHAEAAVEQVRSRERVGTQKHRIEELHAVATSLESCYSREDAYELMRTASKEILGFHWCTLYMLEDGEFITVMTSDESPVTVGERPFTKGESKSREVMETGESNLFDDVHEIDEGDPTSDRIRSALQVPVGDVGVYNAAHEEPAKFDPEDVELAELLASSVAEALDRIEAQERLHEQKQELERKNERLDRFASLVSHDLRGPLTIARLRAELVEGEEKHTGAILDALDRMETMIDEMLRLARAGQDIETTAQCRLDDTVERAWDSIQTGEADLHTSLGDTSLDADESRLTQVFENLFRNALEHNENAPELRVGTLESGDGFYVEDDGTGIPEEDWHSIFERGYTTDEDGTGLGLAIVSNIVEAHGWTITVAESRDGGVRFDVRAG